MQVYKAAMHVPKLNHQANLLKKLVSCVHCLSCRWLNAHLHLLLPQSLMPGLGSIRAGQAPPLGSCLQTAVQDRKQYRHAHTALYYTTPCADQALSCSTIMSARHAHSSKESHAAGDKGSMHGVGVAPSCHVIPECGCCRSLTVSGVHSPVRLRCFSLSSTSGLLSEE